jgi:hypothetical protein
MGLYGISLRGPNVSLLLLHWHFFQMLVAGFNWRFFVSKEESLLGAATPSLHLAFCVFGLLVFALFASVLIYWPYRYGSFMLDKNKRNRLMIGSALVYFFHVLPLWVIEFDILWSYGWMSEVQGVSFCFLSVSWIIETLGVWYAYIWHMSGYMNKNHGAVIG